MSAKGDVSLNIPDKVFSLEELRKYDGEVSPTTYICLKGVVFDVTGSAFYGKGGSYHLIAGRDGSKVLASMKLEPQFVENPSLAGLSDKELSRFNYF